MARLLQLSPGLLLFLAAACAIGAEGGQPAPAPPPKPGVTLANYQRVKEGMTIAEVRAILGGPQLSSRKTAKGPDGKQRRIVYCTWFAQHIRGESLNILIEFEDGKVVSKRESRSKIDPR